MNRKTKPKKWHRYTTFHLNHISIEVFRGSAYKGTILLDHYDYHTLPTKSWRINGAGYAVDHRMEWQKTTL